MRKTILHSLLTAVLLLLTVSVSATTIYFKNTAGWSDVRIYMWDDCSTGSWPGLSMTNTGVDNIWKYETTCSSVNNIIFNCGNSSCQTDNLTFDATKPLYVYSSGWTTYSTATYTIIYDTKGGNDISAVTNATALPSPLPTPTRDGYTFDGWYTDESLSTAAVAGAALTANITLYAKWTEVHTYTYYYYNKKKWTGKVQAHIWNDSGALTGGWNAGDMTAVEGHSGWYSITFSAASAPTYAIFHTSDAKDVDADQAIDSDPAYIYYNSSITQESGHGYWHTGFGDITVTYDANGGSCSTTTATYSTTPLTLPTPTWDGHVFNGWYTAATGGTLAGAAGAEYTPTADITLYAQWTTTYTITYDTKGGNDISAVTNATALPSSLPTPTKDGYTFDGWYTDESLSTAAVAGAALTANITLYAKWSSPCMAINGNFTGSWVASEMTKSNDETTASCTITISSTGTKEFGFKQLKSCGSSDQDKWWSVAKNSATITASNCTDIPFKNSGDIENAKIDMSVAGDYVFTWNYATSTLTVTYPVIETYILTFGVIGDNGTLTAKSGETTITSGTEVSSATLTATPATGYEIEGWYSDAAGTTKITEAGTSTTYTITLTAATSVYVKFAEKVQQYWYMDEKNTGWGTDKGIQMTRTDKYAYIQRTAYSGTDNKFKIFEENNNNDGTVFYGRENVNNGFADTDIELGTGDTEWNNATIGSTDKDYYVILFFPNTTINVSNNYYLCASYSLPTEADPYPVTFGVVDDLGGTLTAQVGTRTITSGTSVTHATFTAIPTVGYAVEGWYSDKDGTTKITGAGTNTTYTLSSISSTNCVVYVKFAQTKTIYLKNNDFTWSDAYVYTFSANPWGDNKGVQPKNNRIEFAQMTKVNDSVFAYTMTKANAFSYVAFNNSNQSGYDEFYKCEVIYRGDHTNNLQMFVSEKAQTAKSVNSTTYRYEGIWMRYNATNAGYKLVLTGNDISVNDYFTTTTPGEFSFSKTVTLTQGNTYTFYITNDNGNNFSRGSDVGNSITKTTRGWQMYQWGEANVPGVTLTPSVTGAYTFNLHLADGKVMFDVIYPITTYRLVYVEQDGSNIVTFHPLHTIKQAEDLTTAHRDTISMHVRPFVKDASGTQSANSNTCEVWLQEYDFTTSAWTTKQTIDAKTLTQNGVYNFVIEQTTSSVSVLSDIQLYTGNYYILTEASEAGWDRSKAQSNLNCRFCYSEYAKQHESFDYYYCHWTGANTDLKYVVANDYSYCITDTLVQTAYEQTNNYVDATGKLLNNANIRFMWNSYDNSLNRAFLAGAGDNLFLLSENGIYDTNGNQQTSMKFADQQNWVYRLDVKADPNTRVKIKAPYAGVTQYFKGAEGDFSDANTFLFIEGTAGNSYNIRVIYDFKTNHLICAWIPEGEINAGESIMTDLMIIRNNQDEAKQLIFNPSDLNINKVNNAYCVLTLTRDYLNGSASAKEKTVYWVSFPFDVRLSEVFGCGTYGEHFAIQYYDGALRAANGCWADSPTYWKYYWETNEVVLKKGHGYVVDIDYQKILSDQFLNGNSEVSIYFPSANIDPMTISGVVESVTYPEHTCTIERDNRYIYDSNWNLLGVPSYANIDAFGNPMVATQIGDYKVGFLYEYDAANSVFNVVDAASIDFRSMRSYLVQFAGTVDWQSKSATGTLPHEVRAKAPAQADEQYTLRLQLAQEGNTLDQTYIRLQEQDATAAFDLNIDLTKQDKSGANIYSLTPNDSIRVAANVLPIATQTVVPLGVSITADGDYTFSLPDGTDGLEAVLVDTEENTRTNLLFGNYTVTLNKGTYENRFRVEIRDSKITTSIIDNTADQSIKKYMIDGELFIQYGERVYDALGRMIKQQR